jgi:hypothetical protein
VGNFRRGERHDLIALVLPFGRQRSRLGSAHLRPDERVIRRADREAPAVGAGQLVAVSPPVPGDDHELQLLVELDADLRLLEVQRDLQAQTRRPK